MTINLTCFKAYDIRGRVPDQLSAEICKAIGAATAIVSKAKMIIVGQDARPDSPAFTEAFADGVRAMGVDVIDLGL